jgi:hypothetical protein
MEFRRAAEDAAAELVELRLASRGDLDLFSANFRMSGDPLVDGRTQGRPSKLDEELENPPALLGPSAVARVVHALGEANPVATLEEEHVEVGIGSARRKLRAHRHAGDALA